MASSFTITQSRTNGSVRFSVLGARSGLIRRLWAPLMRDFETGPARREMNWEREDRIYEFPWKPGDWRTLANRYATAASRVPELEAQARQLGQPRFLVQGTIYPDVVESSAPDRNKAEKIKTHHNVGGLPEDMQFAWLDELRRVIRPGGRPSRSSA